MISKMQPFKETEKIQELFKEIESLRNILNKLNKLGIL